MIDTLAIGFALSLPLIMLAYVKLQPKRQPIRVRTRDAQRRRR